MSMKRVLAASAALLMLATPSMALTITNKDSKAHTVGIDRGDKEEVLKIPGGKSVTVKNCGDGCGVTGPWDYSKFVKTGDKIVFDGKSTTYK